MAAAVVGEALTPVPATAAVVADLGFCLRSSSLTSGGVHLSSLRSLNFAAALEISVSILKPFFAATSAIGGVIATDVDEDVAGDTGAGVDDADAEAETG